MMVDANTHRRYATRLDVHRSLLKFLMKFDLPCLRPTRYKGYHTLPYQDRNNLLRKRYLQEGKLSSVENV